MNVIERMTRARPAHAAPVRNEETLEFLLDRAERKAREAEKPEVEAAAPVETPAARHARLLEQMERARPKP